MGCKQCAKNRERAMQKRRLIDQQRRQRLAEACTRGDQKSCMELQRMEATQAYRQDNRYIPELHRRAG